jgi:hypothetical protein
LGLQDVFLWGLCCIRTIFVHLIDDGEQIPRQFPWFIPITMICSSTKCLLTNLWLILTNWSLMLTNLWMIYVVYNFINISLADTEILLKVALNIITLM